MPQEIWTKHVQKRRIVLTEYYLPLLLDGRAVFISSIIFLNAMINCHC